MPSTIRLAARTFTVGQSVSVTWTPTWDAITVAVGAVQTGTDTSQLRLTVKDSLGVAKASMFITGTDNQQLEVSGLVGSVTAELCCLAGAATAAIVEGTGVTPYGLVDTADCAAGIMEASATGRALFDDDFFTAAEFAAGAGGKFAANCLVTAGIANLFADDSFTAAEFAAGAGGKFAPNCLVTAGLQNLIADDAFTAAEFAAGAGGKFAANCLVTAGVQNLFADDSWTAAEFAAGAGGKFAPNCLVTAGIQNLFADDSWTAAEFAAGAGGKFAPNCLVTAGLQNLIADDAFTAAEFAVGAGGKFAAGCLTAATAAAGGFIAANALAGANATNAFGAGGIPAALIAAGFAAGLDAVIADIAAIAVAASGHCDMDFGGGGGAARTVADPAGPGLTILLTHTAGAAPGTVTFATAIDVQGTTVLNFAATLGQWVLIVSVDDGAGGATYRWAVVAQGGGVATQAPVYVPLAIADPGAGGNIPVTASGRCVITFVAGGHRHLAIPTFEGQKITLESLAASGNGWVDIASGFNDAGATIMNFLGGVNEQVDLEARIVAGALRWRVAHADEMRHVPGTIPDPGNGLYIDDPAAGGATPLHDNGQCDITIAAPADNRNLAIPAYIGQRLTLTHVAGAAAGTVTCDQDITDVGGNNVINFTAAMGETIILVGVNMNGALRWRVWANPDGLVIN